MRIRIPPRKVREKFLIIYELQGAQKGVNFLAKYYKIRTMRITLDGKKVGNRWVASYFQNRAYFSKRGLNKRTVLHELYHHLVYVDSLDIPKAKVEKAANHYARDFVSRHRVGH